EGELFCPCLDWGEVVVEKLNPGVVGVGSPGRHGRWMVQESRWCLGELLVADCAGLARAKSSSWSDHECHSCPDSGELMECSTSARRLLLRSEQRPYPLCHSTMPSSA